MAAQWELSRVLKAKTMVRMLSQEKLPLTMMLTWKSIIRMPAMALAGWGAKQKNGATSSAK